MNATFLHVGGFGMMLFAEQKEYLRSYSYAHSFRLDLHGYNTMCLVEKHPIAIATGTETFIKLKLVTMTSLTMKCVVTKK